MPASYRSERGASSRHDANHGEFHTPRVGDKPTAESMRQLRREIAAAVTVVTSIGSDGYRGVTVSAFCLVSLDPPRLLISLVHGSEALASVEAAGHFAVCVLGDRQEFLADQFAGRGPSVNRRFTGIKHHVSQLGDPVLEECVVWFSAKLDGTSTQGDHTILYGDVREAGFGTGQDPLLYFDGDYRYLRFD